MPTRYEDSYFNSPRFCNNSDSRLAFTKPATKFLFAHLDGCFSMIRKIAFIGILGIMLKFVSNWTKLNSAQIHSKQSNSLFFLLKFEHALKWLHG
jgi:hypothetical protein